jgi:hypothetical protein
MRKTISGMAAAIAVVAASAAPATACGGLFDTCSPCGFVGSPCAPAYVPPYAYSGCATACGWAGYERLPDPSVQYHEGPVRSQYYYVNQGPTYTGPGNFAPWPTYQEGGVYYHPRYHRWVHRAPYHGPVLRRYY